MERKRWLFARESRSDLRGSVLAKGTKPNEKCSTGIAFRSSRVCRTRELTVQNFHPSKRTALYVWCTMGLLCFSQENSGPSIWIFNYRFRYTRCFCNESSAPLGHFFNICGTVRDVNSCGPASLHFSEGKLEMEKLKVNALDGKMLTSALFFFLFFFKLPTMMCAVKLIQYAFVDPSRSGNIIPL